MHIRIVYNVINYGSEQQGTTMESGTGVSTEDTKQLRLDVDTLFEKFKQMQAESAAAATATTTAGNSPSVGLTRKT